MKGAIYYVAKAKVIFSHVKISSFRAKVHLVFHWCLYNKYPYTSEGYATAIVPTFVFRLWATFAVLVLSGQWRHINMAVHNSAGDRTRKMNFKTSTVSENRSTLTERAHLNN